MKKAVLILFALIFFHGCMYAVRYDGTYRGKVIDADTGEPIEGVVVLGVWYTAVIGAGGGFSKYYDARETVTDKNGEFSIPGKGLRIMSNLELMHVLIFKAGYDYTGGAWDSLKESRYYKETIKWERNKPVFPLKKLTMQERKKQGSPVRPNIPIEKMKLMTEEISKERIERGLDPL